MDKQLNVSRKKVFGIIHTYPECDKSKLFCKIAKTETITPTIKVLIQELGFTFNQIIPKEYQL